MVKVAVMFLAVLLSAFMAHADVTVDANGVKWRCEDGLCVMVDDDEGVADNLVTSDSAPRFAQGVMRPHEFISFLRGKSAAEDVSDPSDVASVLSVLVLALIGGVLLNFTPCVLPMIPVNLMIVGRSAIRGLWYGLGIAIAYGTLGLLAAFGAMAFGEIQGNPVFNVVVALVFLALGVSMLGVFTIDFSRWRQRSAESVRSTVGLGSGSIVPFCLGALSAVLSSACVAPVLISVLVLTAKLYAEGKVLALGLPFALGVGMALPWPLLGYGLKLLPKPGAWMKWINRVFAVVAFGLAIWYGAVAYNGWYVRGRLPRNNSIRPDDLPAVLENSKRPILIDCWASWCRSCGEMNRVMALPEIEKELERFTVIWVQAEDISKLRKLDGFGAIRGLPAFVIYE